MTHPIIGEAFVRVRPEFSGFQAQAQQQIQTSLSGVARQTERVGLGARSATRDVERFDRGIVAANASTLGFGRSLAFASTAFLGGAGFGAVIRTGVDEFKNMTTTAAATGAILKATGGAAGITAQGVAALAKQQERLTGTDDELVKQAENVLLSFRRVRNEVGAGNDIFTRATKDSSDLATVFGQDVPSAARQLGRALADPARGVVLLRRAGVVFTQDQIKLIKSLVDTGDVLKAQRLVLDQVEHSVGGTAAAVGRTLPGQLDILRERARDALGDYVKRLSDSRQAAELAASGARGLGESFAVIKGGVQTLGPPLLSVTQGAIKLGEAIGGVGPILAAVAAYKAVGVAVGVAGAAQDAYARAVTIATAANAAETRAVAGASVALGLQARAAASGIVLPAGVAFSAARAEETATSVARIGVAGRAAAVGLGASRLALAAVGGPLGAAALGAGALTIGFLRLSRQAANATGTINATRKALGLLQTSAQHGINLQTRLGGARDAVQQAQAAVLLAQQNLRSAQTARAQSGAQPGSLEARFLTEQVASARDRLRQSTGELDKAERTLAATQRESIARQRGLANVTAEQTAALRKQIDAVTGLTTNVVKGPLGEGVTFAEALTPNEKLRKFLDLMDKLSKTGSSAQRAVGEVLAQLARLGKIPSEKDITVAISLALKGKSLDAIRHAVGLGLLDIPIPTPGAQRLGENLALEQQHAAAEAILKTERDKLQTLKDVVVKRREELQTARDQVQASRDALTNAQQARTAAIEGLQSARQALVDTQTALADAVRSARDSVNQAVRDAKSNLDQLGQSIADAFGKFRDAVGQSVGTGGQLGAQFRALRAEILAGGGGPETQRAAQQIASRLSRTPAPDASKLPQQFADLTDQLDRGKISLPQFNRELTKLLRSLNLSAFQRQFGTAATNTLRDEIAALRAQARLITSGPQRAGGGVQQTLVRPLQAVADGNRQIVQAQRDVRGATRDVQRAVQGVATADRDVARAARRLQESQVKETQKSNVELRAIHAAVIAQTKVLRTQAGLDKNKAKPHGTAAETTGTLTNAGAQTP